AATTSSCSASCALNCFVTPAPPQAIRWNCACSPATTTATTSSPASSATTSPTTHARCTPDRWLAASARQPEVGEGEAPVAQHGFTGHHVHRLPEHRAGMDKRVELAVLPARVAGGRQRVQQLVVERLAGEAGIELCGVDAAQPGLQ